MRKEEIFSLQEEFEFKDAWEILEWACDYFSEQEFAQVSSLGAEGQVLTDMLMKINPKITIFTIDTGRLNQETYDLMEETMTHYQFRYSILFPDTISVEEMVKEYGPNLFYKSVANRKKCCYIRKVSPLKCALASFKGWICGLRRIQSVTRNGIKKIDWDEGNGLLKILPLANWSEGDVWNYIDNNNVPYNKLHDKGYTSIGCAPCTRAVQPGENHRAGRWWWEKSCNKECGLHPV